MIDFRNYTTLIRQLVKDEDKKDQNWKWSVKSIGKNKIRIRWGYLDYCGEKANCFSIEIRHDSTEYDQWIAAYLPYGDIIEMFPITEGQPNRSYGVEPNVQSGIKDAISEIAYYAHSRY